MLPPVFIAWSSVKWIASTPCIPFCMSTASSDTSLPARLWEGQRQLCHDSEQVHSTRGTGWRDISSDGETFLVTKPLLGHTNLLPLLLCPHLTHKQQLSHSRGKIILSRKLALTAKILIDYQIYVLQNSSLEAGQAVLQV